MAKQLADSKCSACALPLVDPGPTILGPSTWSIMGTPRPCEKCGKKYCGECKVKHMINMNNGSLRKMSPRKATEGANWRCKKRCWLLDQREGEAEKFYAQP